MTTNRARKVEKYVDIIVEPSLPSKPIRTAEKFAGVRVLHETRTPGEGLACYLRTTSREAQALLCLFHDHNTMQQAKPDETMNVNDGMTHLKELVSDRLAEAVSQSCRYLENGKQ